MLRFTIAAIRETARDAAQPIVDIPIIDLVSIDPMPYDDGSFDESFDQWLTTAAEAA